MTAPRLTAWLLGGLCALAGASCQKSSDTDPEAVEVSYAATQCADPWGLTTSNQQLRQAAYDYVKAKGITPFSLSSSASIPAAVCSACTCPTGVVLTGTARRADLPALQAIGFLPR